MSRERGKEKHVQGTIFDTQDRDFICFVRDTPIRPSRTFHCHDGYEIFLFLDGETTFYLEHDGKKLRHGDLILIPPYLFHCSCPSPEIPYRRAVINIRNDFPAQKGPDFQQLTEMFYTSDSTQLNLLHLPETQVQDLVGTARRLEQVLSGDAFSAEDELLAEAYLTIILVQISRSVRNVIRPPHAAALPPILASTFQYIDEHLTEPIQLKDVSSSVHLHPVYLNRVFKSYVGMPIQKYLIQKRLVAAGRLLKKGVSPIDVCCQVGYNNYSNFSRSFTSHYGMSPKQYQISSRMNYTVIRQNPD